MGRDVQIATSGSLIGTFSFTGAMDSRVMQRALWTAHVSVCSRGMALSSQVMASWLGKMPITLVRRLIFPWSRSSGLVECTLTRCPFREPPILSSISPQADLAARNPAHSHRLSQISHRLGRHLLDIGRLNHRRQRILPHPPGLQEAGEVAPLPDSRDPELDGAGSGLPATAPVPVAMGDPIRRSLTTLPACQPMDLQLHQPAGGKADHLPQHLRIGTLFQQPSAPS